MIRTALILNIGVTLILAGAFLAIMGTVPARPAECAGQVVVASWYGTESGNRTANGDRFNEYAMTAAHMTAPFGTRYRVTYGGKSVVVTITDRGDFAKYGRAIDLSKGSFARLAPLHVGLIDVCLTRLAGLP